MAMREPPRLIEKEMSLTGGKLAPVDLERQDDGGYDTAPLIRKLSSTRFRVYQPVMGAGRITIGVNRWLGFFWII